MSEFNKTTVALAAIAAIAPTIAATSALIVSVRVQTKVEQTNVQVAKTAVTVDEVHKQTNSMKDALVAAAEKAGEAEGQKKGVARGTANEKARAAAEKAKPFWRR